MQGFLSGFYASAPAVEAVAAVGTLVIAVMVYREAKYIRKMDSIFRQNQAWNDLGNTVAQLHENNRIGELLMGEPIKGKPTPREAFLLMSFFNVVSSEYNAYRAGAIDREYVVHSLKMTSRIVKQNRQWIFAFLRDYGYEKSFLRVVAIVALTSDEVESRRKTLRRELLAASVWGTICGPRFRKWLRKHLDEKSVDALCDGNAEVGDSG